MNFVSLLKMLLQSTGSEWDELLVKYAVKKLSEWPDGQVCAVLEEMLLSAKYKISLADIISKLPKKPDEWLSADEAWGIALEMRDEARSVATYSEIGQAFGACVEVYEAGQKTEAKKLFEKRYDELITKARSENKKPSWYISYGTNQALRADAEREALKRGLISQEKAYYLAVANNSDFADSNWQPGCGGFIA